MYTVVNSLFPDSNKNAQLREEVVTSFDGFQRIAVPKLPHGEDVSVTPEIIVEWNQPAKIGNRGTSLLYCFQTIQGVFVVEILFIKWKCNFRLYRVGMTHNYF